MRVIVLAIVATVGMISIIARRLGVINLSERSKPMPKDEPQVISKPPCHVCGEPMTVKEWKCGCGATTGCSEPSAPERRRVLDNLAQAELAEGLYDREPSHTCKCAEPKPSEDGMHCTVCGMWLEPSAPKDFASANAGIREPEPVAGTQVKPPAKTCPYCKLGMVPNKRGLHVNTEDGDQYCHDEPKPVSRVAGTASAPQGCIICNATEAVTLGYFFYKTLRLWQEGAKLPQMEGVRFDIASEILRNTYSVSELEQQVVELPKGIALSVAGTPRKFKADNLFGVYCGGNPLSVPQDKPIFWEGWQRVADYVNRFPAEPLRTPPAPEQDVYEYPPQIQNIHDRCEANVVSFSNDDVSELLCEIKRLSRLVGK